MTDPRIIQAVQLLSMVKGKELSVKEAVEIIESITKVPELIRAALDRAEKEGLIKRKKGKLILKFSEANFGFEGRITRAKCVDNCRRCGRRITNCHYILLSDSEIGPFGSECIKKLKLA